MSDVFEQSSVQRIFEEYGEMLYKICIVMLRNAHDAEDAVQDVLIKYMVKKPVFDTDGYEKAWLIRVAMNLCKDWLRFKRKHPQTDIESLHTTYAEESEERKVLEVLMNMPPRYKEVLLLYYFEEYKSHEIGKMLRITESAVRKRLERGRNILKKSLEENDYAGR